MNRALQVRTRSVARLERDYSISILAGAAATGRLPVFVAGSEGDDALLLFRAPDFEPVEIARKPGGYISTCSFLREGRCYLVASTQFKPGFDAAASDLRLYPLDEAPPLAPTLLGVLPYTHRVAAFSHGSKDYVLASTLCGGKAHKDDWTLPGGIFFAEVACGAS